MFKRSEEIYIPDIHENIKVEVKYVVLTSEQAIKQGWHFKKKSNDRICIKRYTGNNKNIIIPSEIGGYIVNEIRGNIFYRADIDVVEIPGSIKKIKGECFRQSKVKEIIIADGIKEIESGFAFSCQELVNVHLPATLLKIGNSAFSMCGNLRYINIPERCRHIGKYAFKGSGLEGFSYQDNDDTELNGTIFQNTPLDKNYKMILRKSPFESKEYSILLFGECSHGKGASDIKISGEKVRLGEFCVLSGYRNNCVLDFSECTEISVHKNAFEMSYNYDGSLTSSCIMQCRLIVPEGTKGCYFPECIDVKYSDGKKYNGYLTLKSCDDNKTVLYLNGSILPSYSVAYSTRTLEIKSDSPVRFEKYAVCIRELESVSVERWENVYHSSIPCSEIFSVCCTNLHRIEISGKHVYIPSENMIGYRLHQKLLKAFFIHKKNDEYLYWFDCTVVDALFSDNNISQKRKIIVACDVLRSTESLFEDISVYQKYLQTHKRYALILCDTLPDEYAEFLIEFLL